MPSNYSFFSCILTRVLQGGQTLQIWTFENVCIVPCHSVSGKALPFQNLATFVLVFVIIALSLPCAGQVRPASKTLAIRHISAKITVDGRLDEPVWKTIDPLIDFTQTSPDLGKPISERTEALIFYDDDNLYVGFRCYDSEPKKIVRRMGPHDSSGNSDSVSLFIDPFHDMRTGYYFSVSAGSVQFDALSSEDNSSSDDSPFSRIHDSTWDGIWQSAARLEEWGWSAEFVIPFKSVRLPRASTQVWGLNLRRSMPRKHEVAYWNAVSRFDDTMRPSKSGTLTGLDGLHVGHALELIPFITTKYRRAPWQPESAGTDVSGGLDVRYGLAANLTANLTVNPDFGETEADRFTSEISRYEIFFPEKRKFFTEGANYFSTPLSLFFSRRIGAVLPDGDPQPKPGSSVIWRPRRRKLRLGLSLESRGLGTAFSRSPRSDSCLSIVFKVQALPTMWMGISSQAMKRLRASTCGYSRVITFPGDRSLSPTQVRSIPALTRSTSGGPLISPTIPRF